MWQLLYVPFDLAGLPAAVAGVPCAAMPKQPVGRKPCWRGTGHLLVSELKANLRP